MLYNNNNNNNLRNILLYLLLLKLFIDIQSIYLCNILVIEFLRDFILSFSIIIL